MMEWLEELGVEMVKSDMSFSVSTQLGGNGGIEWGCHNGVSGLLAQKSNSVSPSFWRMIHEIFKFKNNVLSAAYLHHDESLMPRGLSAWSARNFLGTANRGAGKAAASDLLGKKCDLAVNIKVMVPSWTEAGARVLVGRFLKQYISIGNLSLIEQGGSTFSFGEVCQECSLKTVLQVHNPGFYWKVATEADLGLADAYINGYYSFVDNSEGLLNLLLILISNRDARKRSKIKLYKPGLVDSLACILWSNDFFTLFLDPSMSYSSGIFKTEGESLEQAQRRKISLLINKVVKETGCRYTGITLSDQQLVYAQRKVKEAGLEFISIPEERYDEYRRSSDFIKEYIFPGGSLPSLDRIISAMSNASRLCVEHVENIGYHYYSTLMRWRDNFEANRDKVLALGFDDKFIRTWEYYFIYCAAGFKSRTLGDYQVLQIVVHPLPKRNATAKPLSTRDVTIVQPPYMRALPST
ncbi:hypothetical protein PR202_ga25599 [Eleusine coracana subsp. coracana]|uniref:Cyclopropane-fatty-acyl-phospholipid synthase n=1 Tax=Eleusine coracana subsp. coracana TaxID=191504 RepID=A0AAV5DBE6_ELECO|nr:hypothetical protein PR202_ga25599 [Eleusine coracana subsp. coracana]